MSEETVKPEIITDEMYNNKWASMLKTFKKTVEDSPKAEKVKEILEQLKEAALNTNHLTPRQKEGIIDRCNNYLDGSYGRNLATEPHK